MDAANDRPAWKTLAAFFVIYFVWGSTFLAIRIGVHEVPPLLFAAMRFSIAGVVMFAWVMLHGTPLPTLRQWGASCLMAMLIFVMDYGLLFWAEQRVPSGIAAVMLATIPMFMALSEIALLRTQRLSVRLVVALLVGIGGVAVLVTRTLDLGGTPIEGTGAIALIIAAFSWSIASVLTRKLPLPPSKTMSAAAQMLAGGVMLFGVSAMFGEYAGFDPGAVSRSVWYALLYLIVAGSIIGFTAYLWLIHHESPTRVGTYAYVNPVVAVLVGYFLGGEPLGARTLLGTALVLVSVVVITTLPGVRTVVRPLRDASRA